MEINRNNYEEFFLLYLDKELSEEQQREVEAFVLANPDLEQEFRMIQDSRLKPDLHVVFEDKRALLKEEKKPVSVPPGDYETSFLLYVDNELDNAARMEVERLVQDHPILREELDLLKNTRLPDEPVEFKEKSLLYRRETRIVSYRTVLGWTAAAAVLVFALIRFSRPVEHSSQTTVQTKQGTDKQVPAIKKEAIAVTPGHSSPLHDGKPEATTNDIAQKDVTAVSEKNEEDLSKAASQQDQRKAVVDEMISTNSTEVGGQQKIFLHAETISGTAESLMNEQSGQNAQDVAAGPQEINPYAKQVAIQEPFPGNEDGIKIMAFSAKKNTMRGIFRKVSRVLGKTANADDDDKRGILIGNVQVGLK